MPVSRRLLSRISFSSPSSPFLTFLSSPFSHSLAISTSPRHLRLANSLLTHHLQDQHLADTVVSGYGARGQVLGGLSGARELVSLARRRLELLAAGRLGWRQASFHGLYRQGQCIDLGKAPG